MRRFPASRALAVSTKTLLCFQLGRLPIAVLSLGLLALHAGCMNSKLAVSAINNPSVDVRQTFVLVNRNAGEADDGLRFQERVEIIKQELATRGMYEAPNHAAADLIIRVETRVESFYKSIEVLDVRYSSPSGRHDSDVAQIVSDAKKTIRIPYYKTVLSLTAVENSSSPGTVPALVWKVEAAVESEKINLRAVLPELASAAAAYIGEETTETLKELAGSSRPTVQHVPNRSRLLAR